MFDLKAKSRRRQNQIHDCGQWSDIRILEKVGCCAGAGEIWIVSSPARGARASEAESILCKRVTELARAARTTPCIKPASVHRRAQ